jgi:hypothetical protein
MSGDVAATETFTQSKESNFTVYSIVISDQDNCTLSVMTVNFSVEVMKAYGEWRYKSMQFLTLVLDVGRFTSGERNCPGGLAGGPHYRSGYLDDKNVLPYQKSNQDSSFAQLLVYSLRRLL